MGKQLGLFPPDVDDAAAHLTRNAPPIVQPFLAAIRPGLKRARKRTAPIDGAQWAFCPNCRTYIEVE